MIPFALLAIATVVFVLGLLYCAKFLLIAVFPASMSPPTGGDRSQQTIAFGYHSATVAGASTIIGVGIGVAWGWAPAFLWIVGGTAILAGTLAIGSLWMRQRYSPEELFGEQGARALYGLLAAWMLCLNPLLALLVAELIAAVPAAIWPVFLLTPISLLLGQRMLTAPLLFGVLTMLLLVAITGLSQWWLPSISGTIIVAVADWEWSLEPHRFWVIPIIALAYLSTTIDTRRLAQPKGYLAALSITIIAVLAVVGLILSGGGVEAPPYHEVVGAPKPFPLLFMVLTGGAVAAFHTLIDHQGAPNNPLGQARFGYGIAVADGLLAIAVLFVVTNTLANGGGWEAHYAEWPLHGGVGQWLLHIVNALAAAVNALGIPSDWSQAFAAFAVASLAMVALEAGIRVQQFLIECVEPAANADPLRPQRHHRRAVIGIAVLGFFAADQYLRVEFWVLTGAASQLFVGAVFFALTLSAMRAGRNAVWLLAPALVISGITLWALGSEVMQWWLNGDWPRSALGATIWGLGAWMALAAGHALTQRPDTSPRIRS